MLGLALAIPNMPLIGQGRTIQAIQGSKLRLLVEPWSRPDLTVESGGLISSITGSVAGVVFSEAVGSAMPASTNGGRKIPRGDGVDDKLTTTTMGWAPTTPLAASFSAFGVGFCDLDPAADTATHSLFAFGNAQVSGFKVHRLSVGGAVNRLQVAVGDGVGSTTSSSASANATISGGFYWWADVTATGFTVWVNNLLVDTYAVVPSFTLSRARLLANANGTAGQFAKLNLGVAGVANLNTTEERAATSALLAAIASQIAA